MNTTKTTLVLATAGLVAVAACQPEGGPAGEAGAADVDTAAILASTDSLRSAYQQAVAEDDYGRLGGMVSEDALIVGAGGAAWDAVRDAAGEAPFPPGATLEITPRETRVLTEDWVYELGSATLTWTPEGSDQPLEARDTYLVLLHRTDDGWKVHREVASSNRPAAADTAGDG